MSGDLSRVGPLNEILSEREREREYVCTYMHTERAQAHKLCSGHREVCTVHPLTPSESSSDGWTACRQWLLEESEKYTMVGDLGKENRIESTSKAVPPPGLQAA